MSRLSVYSFLVNILGSRQIGSYHYCVVVIVVSQIGVGLCHRVLLRFKERQTKRSLQVFFEKSSLQRLRPVSHQVIYMF